VLACINDDSKNQMTSIVIKRKDALLLNTNTKDKENGNQSKEKQERESN